MGTTSIEVEGLDKLAHLIFYAGLAFLANHQKIILDNSKLKVPFVLLFCSMYGFGIELIQGAIIEGRYFELWDLIANIIGTFIGIVISIFFFK